MSLSSSEACGFNPALQRGEVGDHLECNEHRLCRMMGLYDMGSDKRADRLDGLLPKKMDAMFPERPPSAVRSRLPSPSAHRGSPDPRLAQSQPGSAAARSPAPAATGKSPGSPAPANAALRSCLSPFSLGGPRPRTNACPNTTLRLCRVQFSDAPFPFPRNLRCGTD